ncbi:MAG: response regulator, partial [Chitinispirillaceae bacterium]|nr:response regulator [Chitinispirillaceae bacterium]
MQTKPTVLLVDDDDDFLLQHKIYLSNAGYNVITAKSRKEAELIAKQQKIDCALIDLMMEEADSGFILAYHLKKDNPSLPVIIITSVTGETGIEFKKNGKEQDKWIKADVI